MRDWRVLTSDAVVPAALIHTHPFLPSFVRAATAEADIAEEVQEQDVHNFQSGMVRGLVLYAGH